MKNTNIVKLLKTFSLKEFKGLEAFINTPVKNRKRDVSRQFNAIKKFYPDFENPSFTDEKIFGKIFPGQKFDKARYAVEAFHLFDTACVFLANEDYNKNNLERDFSLLRQLSERGMESSFEKLSKKMGNQIIPENYPLEKYFYYRYLYEDLLMSYFTRKNKYDLIIDHYMKKSECSTGLFLLRSLRSAQNKFIAEKAFELQPDTLLLDIVQSATDFDKIFSRSSEHSYLKMIKPVFYISKGMTGEDSPDLLTKAEQSFFEYIDLYSKEDKVYIYRELLNLYKKIMDGISEKESLTEYFKKEFELTKLAVKNDLLRSRKDKYITPHLFRNTLMTGLENKDFEWAEKFVAGNASKLKPVYQEIMKNFSFAQIEFEKGNFENSLELLSNTKFKDFLLNRDVKFLLLCLFYELELYEQSYYMLDTTSKYIKKTHELRDEEKIWYDNFLKYYKILIRLTEKPDPAEIDFNIKSIKNEYNNIEGVEWMLRKFKSLQ